MTEGTGRTLAAIMFTDVVGYTGLTESDEATAIAARNRHRGLLKPLVEQFEGELLETPGDESLSVFPSAILAVDCALAVQASLRDDQVLKLRIGIHLGDVLRRDGEVIGEGVNVAARIRPLAEPGGICVSEAVWRQVRGRGHVSGRPRGPQRFKNVSEPLEVFALEAGRFDPERTRSRRRRVFEVAGGLVLTSVLAYALYVPNRTVVLASVALWAPKVVASPIEQKLAFATASDGVRIAYATTGAGPAVVSVLGWATHLENGLMSPVYDTDGLLPTTSRAFYYVRYDGRGFGLSDRNVNDFSLDARVRDIEAVVDAAGLKRFAVYAQSAGGPAALAYTARHPDRVSRLVLASTMASSSYIDAQRRASFLRVLDLVETDWQSPPVSNLFVEILFPGNQDDVSRRIFSEFLRRAANGPQLAGFMRAQLDTDATAEARQVAVPTLVIHARDDSTVKLEAGRELASLIPGARFEIIDGNHREGTGNAVASRTRILAFLSEATW